MITWGSGKWGLNVWRICHRLKKNLLLLSKQTIMGWKITSKRILNEIFILSMYNCKVFYCTYRCRMQHFATFRKWNLPQNPRKAAFINSLLRESLRLRWFVSKDYKRCFFPWLIRIFLFPF